MAGKIYDGAIWDRLLAQVGVLSKIYGSKVLSLVIYDRVVSNNKHILSQVFGFQDVYAVFPDVVHDDRFRDLNKMVTGYFEATGNGNSAK